MNAAMIDVELCRILPEPWLGAPAVVAGHRAVACRTPDSYAMVSVGDAPLFRIDLHAYPEEHQAFQEALVWNGRIAIGFGERLYLLDLESRRVREFELESYFGHLYPLGDRLLVASAERVFCFGVDGQLLWRSSVLGIDGVVFHDADDHEIHGAGEWDPPGGWKEFRLAGATGALLSAGE